MSATGKAPEELTDLALYWRREGQYLEEADAIGDGVTVEYATKARETANEIERLRKIEVAARALKFSAYPAHGSGFVIQVTGGNVDDLAAALNLTK